MLTNQRKLQCHEETEQAQEAKAPVRVEAWDGAAAAAGEAAALAQALVETVFAPTAVKRFPTSWESLALSKNAPSVVRR